MNILVASGTWYPERNGVARVATEVARRLAERGHTVEALVPRVPSGPTEEREGSLVVHRVIERGRMPLTIRDVLETRMHARGLGPFDVALAHGPMTAVGIARARLRTPLVLVFHASHASELRFTRPRLGWGRDRLVAYLNEPITSVLEGAAVRRSSRILALSRYTEELIATRHQEQLHKVRRVSGGVDVDWFCPEDGQRSARERLGVDPARKLLVAVRRAEPRLGLDRLLHAVASLDGPNSVALAVVGGGLLTEELVHLSDDLGLGDRVRFTGRVEESELRDWYRAADLVVLPTVAYEGFGMVTAEALATGTPVVGTPVGATPELLEPLDPRFVAGGSDPHALAAAIQNALGFVDPQWRSRCREYAVARFDWSRVIVDWDDALADATLAPDRARPRVSRA
jgi:glycosyltransferase involved in cell wall biosynthesis